MWIASCSVFLFSVKRKQPFFFFFYEQDNYFTKGQFTRQNYMKLSSRQRARFAFQNFVLRRKNGWLLPWLMDLSNSTVKGKLSKAVENTTILSLGEMITILHGCLFFIILKAECGFTTLMNLGLPVNPRRNWALSTLFTFTKVKEKNSLSTF